MAQIRALATTGHAKRRNCRAKMAEFSRRRPSRVPSGRRTTPTNTRGNSHFIQRTAHKWKRRAGTRTSVRSRADGGLIVRSSMSAFTRHPGTGEAVYRSAMHSGEDYLRLDAYRPRDVARSRI